MDVTTVHAAVIPHIIPYLGRINTDVATLNQRDPRFFALFLAKILKSIYSMKNIVLPRYAFTVNLCRVMRYERRLISDLNTPMEVYDDRHAL